MNKLIITNNNWIYYINDINVNDNKYILWYIENINSIKNKYKWKEIDKERFKELYDKLKYHIERELSYDLIPWTYKI